MSRPDLCHRGALVARIVRDPAVKSWWRWSISRDGKESLSGTCDSHWRAWMHIRIAAEGFDSDEAGDFIPDCCCDVCRAWGDEIAAMREEDAAEAKRQGLRDMATDAEVLRRKEDR